MERPLLVGVTGGIATGKSTVLRLLKELGSYTIDADALAHEALAPGNPCTAQVARVFGPEYLRPDGSVDRRALGRRVFKDPAARQQLEAIVHPWVLQRLDQEVEEARRRGARVVAAEIPLLFEAGLAGRVDVVVVVACSPESQRARLQARDGLSPGEAEARIRSQWPLAEKIARAHYVVHTDAGLEAVRKQVLGLWHDLRTHQRPPEAG